MSLIYNQLQRTDPNAKIFARLIPARNPSIIAIGLVRCSWLAIVRTHTMFRKTGFAQARRTFIRYPSYEVKKNILVANTQS